MTEPSCIASTRDNVAQIIILDWEKTFIGFYFSCSLFSEFARCSQKNILTISMIFSTLSGHSIPVCETSTYFWVTNIKHRGDIYYFGWRCLDFRNWHV